MAWFVRKHAFTASRKFLKSVFITALVLFVLFAYLLYTYEPVLLSPSADFNYTFGTFLVWTFIGGLFVTLVVMAVILYIFFHDHEHEY